MKKVSGCDCECECLLNHCFLTFLFFVHLGPTDKRLAYHEYLEKTRAMSRLYSQRNRDKTKNQIDELTELKDNCEKERTSLRLTNQEIKEKLLAAHAENMLLRRQIQQRRREEFLLQQQQQQQFSSSPSPSPSTVINATHMMNHQRPHGGMASSIGAFTLPPSAAASVVAMRYQNPACYFNNPYFNEHSMRHHSFMPPVTTTSSPMMGPSIMMRPRGGSDYISELESPAATRRRFY
jgi:hypothetical protein